MVGGLIRSAGSVVWRVCDFQFCQGCVHLMITAEQLQGDAALLGQGPAGHHQHDAIKVVEVAAHDHVHPFGIAHGRIYPLEQGDGTLVGRLTGAAVHVHVVDFVTCGATDRKKCVSCWCRCCIYDMLKA